MYIGRHEAKLEEQVAPVGADRQIADLVNDEQTVALKKATTLDQVAFSIELTCDAFEPCADPVITH